MTIAIATVAALAVVQLAQPLPSVSTGPFAAFLGRSILPLARVSATAFGRSGEVKVRFALPGREIEYPLDVHGDPAALSYSWVRVGERAAAVEARPLVGAKVQVPLSPGFYRLTIVQGRAQRVIEGLTVAVLVPFDRKVGGAVNGYRIGTYLSERFGGLRTPDGFLEIRSSDLQLPVTKHLRVADFINHDRQQVWPRYSAVSLQLLDKIELVVAEISRWHGSDSLLVDVDVKSGFRSPEHNRTVRRAARDSRHQYGDAADVAMDADGDGRITERDSRLVGLAVEIVEMRHPELIGGLGLYLRGRHPYVHIDARGKRARWRG